MLPGVPGSLTRKAFEAVADHLQNHPLFANRRVVKTWLFRDGKRGAEAPPPVASMPAARLTLLGGPVQRKGAGPRTGGAPRVYLAEHRPTVVLELWTPGTDARDLADLADLIVDALFPQDLERVRMQAKFKQVGIDDWEMTRYVLPVEGQSFATDHTAGQGSLELSILFNS